MWKSYSSLAIGLVVAVQSAIAQQPILSYSFDDQQNPTANDGSLGPSHNGQLDGDTIFVSFGAAFAVSFDGSGDHVIPTGSQSVFNMGEGNFSLAATVSTSYSEPGNSNCRFVITKQNSGNLPSYSLCVRRDTGLVSFSIANGSAFLFASSTTAVNDGESHDLFAVRNNSLLRLYVDGILESSAAIPGAFGSTNNSNPLVIGGRTPGPWVDPGDFIGIIDNVRIYNAALAPPSIPTISEWGVILMASLLILAGAVVVSRRRRSAGRTLIETA